jgi:hypothetical protein
VRRTLFLVTTIALLALAPTAGAAPNPRSHRIPFEQPAHLVLTGLCPFTVVFGTVVNGEFAKTHQNGTTIVTGRLVVQVTNQETGASKTYNVSGPVRITPETSTTEVVEFLGRSLLTDPSLGVIVSSGRLVVRVDLTTGSFTVVSSRGEVEDVCQTLA